MYCPFVGKNSLQMLLSTPAHSHLIKHCRFQTSASRAHSSVEIDRDTHTMPC